MSTLLIDELYPGVTFSQTIKVTRDMNVGHIRPWIYLQGNLVDGQLQLEVKDGATSLITKTLDYTLINAIKTETYFHGFIRFDFDSLPLRIPSGSEDKEYILEFSMINHTKDTTNFIAITRRWELKTYDTYGDVVSNEALNDMVEPAGLEIYEYKGV